MARKKLSVKQTKKQKPSLKKRLEIKAKDTKQDGDTTLADVFAHVEFVQASATIITDDKSISLIVEYADDFLYENGIANKLNHEPFEIDALDLRVEFNRKEQLDESEIDESTCLIGNVGSIPSVQYKWLKQSYPSCVFHQVTKWFGKAVNTLVIVLAEESGKPVAIVKTQE